MKYTIKVGDTEQTYEAENAEDIKKLVDTIQQPQQCSTTINNTTVEI